MGGVKARPRILSRGLRAMGALVVALFLASAFTPLSTVLGYWTSVPAELRRADAIVVLGAGGPTPPGILSGSSLRKTFYGILLFRRGFAPLLVLSGATDEGGQREEVSRRVELARDHGVPPEAILAETMAGLEVEPTTRGEAARIRKLLAGRAVRTILLVTDSQHMRRARRVFGSLGFEVGPAPIDEIPLDASSPEDRLRLTRWIGEEWAARLYYVATGNM